MDKLILSVEYWQEMLLHVQMCLPEEACGLLAGTGSRVEKVYPVTNEYHSKDRFRMNAQEQVSAMVDIDGHDWEMLAIYHSHPQGPGYPSPTDRNEFFYPGSLYLIWYPIAGKWQCRAYRIDDCGIHDVAIQDY